MTVESSVLEELVPGSKRLYFIFGGIAAGIGMPPFEFYNASKILEENKVFFRDFSQTWYQNGLPGIGPDLFAVHDYLAERIRLLNPREIYFVGNSMGGYAAILFAALTGSGTAIAFAPQTFVSPLLKTRHLDPRWPKQSLRTWISTVSKRHVWDLNAFLMKHTSQTRIKIYVSNVDRLDLLHARRLATSPMVNLHEYDIGGHALVRHLRDEGLLAGILQGK